MGDEKPEKTAGGSTVVRYGDTERDFAPSGASSGAEAIEDHCQRFFGKAETVLHELVSDLVHVDLHVIPPHAERDCWTLFTTGMSDLPMTVPDGAEDYRYAELLLMLPRDWNMEALKVIPPAREHARWYWPIGWLKTLARFPHAHRTWLGSLHTIPNGDPPAPFSPETTLCAWWLLPPISVPAAGRTITIADRTVNLYCMHALHADELGVKLEDGSDVLLDAFEANHVSEILDPQRASVSNQ